MLNRIDRYNLEVEEKWDHYISMIPFFKFPSYWEIQIIPPFHGALIRFMVRDSKSKKNVSVYLDVNKSLGIFEDGGPYWEIYITNSDREFNDTRRLPLSENGDELISAIKNEIKEDIKGEKL